MVSYLEFEKPVAALESRIAELRQTAAGGDVDLSAEIRRIEAKSADLLASTYAALTPWQKTQVARHPMRPHFKDFVELAFTDFVPLGGDRLFGEDEAIVGGFAIFSALIGPSTRWSKPPSSPRASACCRARRLPENSIGWR